MPIIDGSGTIPHTVTPQATIPHKVTPQSSQDDVNGVAHKNDGISGASSQVGSQSKEELLVQAQQNSEALKSSKNILGVGNTNDVVSISVSAVTGNAPKEQDEELNQDARDQAKDSADIEAKAKEYLAQYNNKTDDQKQANDEDNAINGLKRVFGKDVSEEKLNQYRDQMKSYFGVDLFARGSNSNANGNNATDANKSFANFTDNNGNLRDINGYMDTLGRVKTDNPSVRITTAAELQNYARDHYDDDMNYVKEGNAENTFGEERHQLAKSVNSKSEDYSFKDHLSQVGREIYKARYARTDTDQSQGVQENKEDNALGTAKTGFLNTITQSMASDTSAFTQYDFADIRTASQDLNDDITSSDTTYAVSGAGRS